jgi:isocitrate dehydrogenase kinase/phosphatase
MFPHQLTDQSAFDIAQALLDGFNRHYRLFRETTALAQQRFEAADWHGQQRAQAQRIEFYDQRVNEAVQRLRANFQIDALSMDTWQQAKLHYIGLLTDHHQPELAETFFNSVTAKLLHRVHRKRRTRFPPNLPRLLPKQGHPARNLEAHHHQPAAAARVC